MLCTRVSLQIKRHRVSKWKNIFYGNGNEKTARVAILISDKIGVKTKTVKKDKKGIL